MFFTIQSSIVLLTVGLFMYLCLIPVAEASEQPILQKVIPPERQGRVFGFAQNIEQAASPVTAFVIDPIAQFIFIPFMATGVGVDLIGEWFGTGTKPLTSSFPCLRVAHYVERTRSRMLSSIAVKWPA